jgi:hypothetical protein
MNVFTIVVRLSFFGLLSSECINSLFHLNELIADFFPTPLQCIDGFTKLYNRVPDPYRTFADQSERLPPFPDSYPDNEQDKKDDERYCSENKFKNKHYGFTSQHLPD